MANKEKIGINALAQEPGLEEDSGVIKNVSGSGASDENESDKASVWKDKYLHLLADLENTKKRLDRVSNLELEVQKRQLLQDVLQIADGLDLTLNHISGKGHNPIILQGIERLKEILEKFFITYDVKMIDALGEEFDPNFHEALGMIRHSSAKPNTVLKIGKQGYLYHDKLLRPAQVLVASD